ncbi:putative calcium-binding protein CML19 [Dendrobium catenatum]|uniref:putative calcium-binding protein CML19 n=1 Tax=Dendrobium catenatum TaxID=906689 RepID=UPI00109EF3FA|nr:putative calcium-binding protein CML19 [Dendrobium catenatum]
MKKFPSKSGCGGPSFLSKIRAALSPKNLKNPPPLPQPPCFSPPHAEFQQVFRYFDKDGDCKISAFELCSSMGSAFNEQLLQAELIELVESSDSDGDGKLGYEDFLKLVEVEEEEKGRSLREAFVAYEMEGKGFITARSLKRALQRLGEERTVEDCKNMIKRFDLDEDGVISFAEFQVMML